MKQYLSNKLLRAFLLAVAFTLLSATVAHAIAQPTSFQISQVNAYQHLTEDNDQLYLVTFDFDDAYAPAESISEAWIVRILDAASVEVGRAVPYAYPTDGYDEGCLGIYFSATDALTWSGTYTIELTGNPSLSWDAGDPPSTSTGAITWSTSTGTSTTSTELTARIRYLATAFETDWGIDLVELTSDGNKLTSNGEDYFGTVIPYVRDICPNLYSSTVVVPEFEEREYTQTQATTAESRWLGDSLLDFTTLSTTLGVTRMWTMAVLYVIFAIGCAYVVSKRTQSTRPATYLVCHVLVIGAVIGFMPFVIAPIIGALGLLGIVLGVAWSGAS